MDIRVFGLTGGIATGKSTISNRWRKRGLGIIDADDLARKAVEPGTPGIKYIIEEFGESIAPDGVLLRHKLRDIVFSSKEKLNILNSIMGPLITAYFYLELRKFKKINAPIVCYDAALICESGHQELYTPLVVTHATRIEQLNRMISRGMSEQIASAMIDAQMPSSDKASIADFVIVTSGPKEETAKRADAVLDAVLRKLSINLEMYQEPDPIKIPRGSSLED